MKLNENMKKRMFQVVALCLFAGAITTVAYKHQPKKQTVIVEKSQIPNYHPLTAGITSELQNITQNAWKGKYIVIDTEENKKRVVAAQEQHEKEYFEDLLMQAQLKEEEYVRNYTPNVPNEEIGCKSEAFSYEYRQNITKKSSDQYKQLQQPNVYTDELGYVKLDDRYLIAVGTAYAGNVGDKIDVLYEDGTILKCIVGDFKSDRHTDPSHRYHVGGWETRLVDVDTGENFVLGTDTGARNVVMQDLYFEGDGSVVEFILDWNYSATKINPIGKKIISVVNVTNMSF